MLDVFDSGVVYQVKPPGAQPKQLVFQPMPDGKPKVVATAPTGLGIAYGGGDLPYLAWTDLPPNAEQGDATGWRMYAEDIDGGSPVLIAKDDLPPGKATLPGFPSLSGATVVWDQTELEGGAPVEQLWSMNLATGHRALIHELTDTATRGMSLASISGSNVVFDVYVRVSGQMAIRPDIYMYNLESKVLTQLTHSGDSYEPRISGEWVVWTTKDGTALPGGVNPPEHVVAFNLRTQRTTDIVSNEPARTAEYWGANVGTSAVGWFDDANESLGYFDLSCGEIRPLTPGGIPSGTGVVIAHDDALGWYVGSTSYWAVLK